MRKKNEMNKNQRKKKRKKREEYCSRRVKVEEGREIEKRERGKRKREKSVSDDLKGNRGRAV